MADQIPEGEKVIVINSNTHHKIWGLEKGMVGIKTKHLYLGLVLVYFPTLKNAHNGDGFSLDEKLTGDHCLWMQEKEYKPFTGFKKGDKVKIIDRLVGNETGACDCYGRGDIGRVGFVSEVLSTKKLTVWCDPNREGDYLGIFDWQELQLLEEDIMGIKIDELEVGQILYDEDGDKITVLAICGKLVALSCTDDPDIFAQWLTQERINDQGLRLSKEEEVEELTVEEVSKRLGKTVKIVK